jgi:hypothetical protein
MPKEVKNKRWWLPQNNLAENKLTEWLKKLWGNRYE